MGEGCREDATSRRTISRPGAGAGVAAESRAYLIVLSFVASSHKKSAETSLGAADTSVCATFISPEGCKNVETPAHRSPDLCGRPEQTPRSSRHR